MKSHGVECIQTKDAHFDPSLHEAMMQRSEPDKEENIILEEFQRGYTLGQRVIRPSRVIVNKYVSQETISEQEAEASDKEEEQTQSSQEE
jgi:molecular chaperone GrpE (heat shock protein)